MTRPAGARRLPGRCCIGIWMLVALVGCAAWSPGQRQGRALAPANAPAERTFQQVLTIRHGDRRQRLIAAGEICRGHVRLALLTPQGLSVLRLHQDATGLHIDQARGLPAGVTPRAILADFQLVYWPAAALRAAWGPDWALTETAHARSVAYRGQPRLRVEYAGAPWRQTVRLDNRHYDYGLRVRPISQHPGCGAEAGAGE